MTTRAFRWVSGALLIKGGFVAGETLPPAGDLWQRSHEAKLNFFFFLKKTTTGFFFSVLKIFHINKMVQQKKEIDLVIKKCHYYQILYN